MSGEDGLRSVITTVASGEPLSEDAAYRAFGTIMEGEATPSQIGGLLMGLRVRGETVDELTGAVRAMRERMTTVDAPADAIDIVGTGGDGLGTYNVSTCAAFVLAGCGLPVAKHGNRALSSRSGAADVLSALGIATDLDANGVARCIREAGIGFMFAPNHHAAMRHVGPTRVELGTRTIFNLLGPLSNPAGVKRLMVGVYAPEWCEPLARTLGNLGAESAWVVHGDGLDEVTTTGTTKVARLRGGAVDAFTIEPSDANVPVATIADLKGGDATANAEALRSVLRGEDGPYRDIVLMNVGAALVVADRAATLADGVALAAEALDTGQARDALERLVKVSNGEAAP